MDAAVEVAVAGQHRHREQVTVDNLLLDHRVQRTGHAVAGSAGKGDDAEAKLLQFWQQFGFLEVGLHRFRARRQRALHPGLAGQAEAIGIPRDQAGGDHVARVRGVGAAGDCGDDHGAIGHLPRLVFPRAGNAAACQFRHRQLGVRVRRPGHGALDAGQVEVQHALVLRRLQRIGPQTSFLGVGLDQRDAVVVAAGQTQIIDGLLVDVEHRRGGAVFRRHVGDGGAITDRQAVGTFAVELQIRADHSLATQELGQRQHHVGAGDARLEPAAQLDANDVRQAHHRGTAQHHRLGFEAADADGNHAQRIDHRRVRVGADAGIREGHAVAQLDYRRHLLQVDLMHDAVAGRDHVDVLEGVLAPVDEVEAVEVAAILHGAVLLERVLLEAWVFHSQRVIDDQLGRHHRVHFGRITTLVGDGVAQAGQIDQRGLPKDVVADHARREPGEVALALALHQLAQAVLEDGRIAAAHQVLGMDTRRVGQAVPRAFPDRLHRLTGVEVVVTGSRKWLAVGGIHAAILAVNVCGESTLSVASRTLAKRAPLRRSRFVSPADEPPSPASGHARFQV